MYKECTVSCFSKLNKFLGFSPINTGFFSRLRRTDSIIDKQSKQTTYYPAFYDLALKVLMRKFKSYQYIFVWYRY